MKKTLSRKWAAICEALEDPAVELDAEEFAAMATTFKALRQAGHQFDRAFVALIGCLERQLIDTAADSDADGTDAHLYISDRPTWGTSS